MKTTTQLSIEKPRLRGHFHQAAFFIAIGACLMLLSRAHGLTQISVIAVYALSLVTLFGVSALYHRVQWDARQRAWMRRLDHSAIFFLIAGTVSPIALIGLGGSNGLHLLIIVWSAAAFGILQSLLWVNAPKWLSAVLYVVVGWLVLPYLSEIEAALGSPGLFLLFSGGILYSVGAVVYALKWPNPWPQIFGYHEIFHFLVVVAATFHFFVVNRLLTQL